MQPTQKKHVFRIRNPLLCLLPSDKAVSTWIYCTPRCRIEKQNLGTRETPFRLPRNMSLSHGPRIGARHALPAAYRRQTLEARFRQLASRVQVSLRSCKCSGRKNKHTNAMCETCVYSTHRVLKQNPAAACLRFMKKMIRFHCTKSAATSRGGSGRNSPHTKNKIASECLGPCVRAFLSSMYLESSAQKTWPPLFRTRQNKNGNRNYLRQQKESCSYSLLHLASAPEYV